MEDPDLKHENDELRKAKVYVFYKPLGPRAVAAAVRYVKSKEPPQQQMSSSSFYEKLMQRS